MLGLSDDAPDRLVQIASGEINNITFTRAIAKIAFCGAVPKYGLIWQGAHSVWISGL
jgi:hypothetical protein